MKTAEDFGSQGESPSHPELLDWLATEFVRTRLGREGDCTRLIVTSATYRQSSHVTPELLQRDPDNRLLARGPRVPLAGRDDSRSGAGGQRPAGREDRRAVGEAVSAAGLVEGIDRHGDYEQDHGEKLCRRSLYTFWKRTSPPPTMIDLRRGGPRDVHRCAETRTNTPLQALALMNDVTFVEAARVLAQRMMREGGATPEERIALAFRLVLARAAEAGGAARAAR